MVAAEDPPVVAPDGQGRLQPQPHPGVSRAPHQGHHRQQRDQLQHGDQCPSALPGAGAASQLPEEIVPGQNHNSCNVILKN